ncbi:aldehyde dehydrogenase family protein [Micromonospora sp. DT48]|uniref:aldehyde dehydrogenase family protein n=1 Tax=unclassified Micromonospora TaxID=2617518 RepID=UPI001322CD1C|nr:aldehyde dehydrogenase family protein [Micromonospora sp. CP22]MTK01500.1 aldehyde dehydrogenase [Micromonospora sp. CP22]
MAVLDPPLDRIPTSAVLIGGDHVPSATGGIYRHHYAATGRPTVEVVGGGAAEMSAAVAAARSALPRWWAMPPAGRRDALLRLADLIIEDAETLTELQVLEIGLPRQFAAATPQVAADFLRYNAGWIDKSGGEVVAGAVGHGWSHTLDEPYGVVAALLPYNGAVAMLGQVLGPVLAAGNAVVVKPSELAPFTAVRIGEHCRRAGLPTGLVNVVTSDAVGGEALVRTAGVDKIHLTGGVPTARRILTAAAERLTPASLELGGSSAHLIFADADLRAAARQALSGAVILNGQACARASRILVEDSVYDRVLDLVLSRLSKLVVGDPQRPGTVLGPLVSQAAVDHCTEVIDRARRDAAVGKLVIGGERLGGDLADGYFVAPTVFSGVEPAAELVQEEVLGPVLAFSRFSTEDDAVAVANGTRYGLAAYLHTTDLRRAHRLVRALDAGAVWVNGFSGLSPATPFGGTGHSGYGRLGGRAGVEEFRRPKAVWFGR